MSAHSEISRPDDDGRPALSDDVQLQSEPTRKRFKPWKSRQESSRGREFEPPRPQSPMLAADPYAFAVPKRVQDWLDGPGAEVSGKTQTELRAIFARQVAVLLVTVPDWMPDQDLTDVPDPSEALQRALKIGSSDSESNPSETSVATSRISTVEQDRTARPQPAQTDRNTVTITSPLVQSGRVGVIAWTDPRGQHELRVKASFEQVHVAAARRLDSQCDSRRANTPKVTGLSHPYLAGLLKDWLESQGGRLIGVPSLASFLLQVVQDLHPFFRADFDKVRGQLETAAQRPEWCIRYDAVDGCLKIVRKDIWLTVHSQTSFDHLVLPTLQESEDMMDHSIRITGKDMSDEQRNSIRQSSAVRLVASYLHRVMQVADKNGRLSPEDSKAISTDFRDDVEKANRMSSKKKVSMAFRSYGGGHYTLVRLGSSERAFRQTDETTISPRAVSMYWYLRDEVDSQALPDYEAIWQEADDSFGKTSVWEAVDFFRRGIAVRNVPISVAVKTRIARHGCPLVGLHEDLCADFFFCRHSGSTDQSALHRRLDPLKAGKMGSKVLCLDHTAQRDARYFVDIHWAERSIKGFTERGRSSLADYISVDQLLAEALPSQVGLSDAFLPLLAKDHGESRKALVLYILGLGAAPRPEYEVDQFLETPSLVWDMSKYLDPSFVRVKRIRSILAQRLPSVDKLFNLRHDSSVGWYQHRPDNIRLTTVSGNRAKSNSVVPFVADLLDYAIFLHQTASRVIGDDEAASILAVIEEILDQAYASGEASVQTWRGSYAKIDARQVERHCRDVLAKTVMETSLPLAASSRNVGKDKGKSKAAELPSSVSMDGDQDEDDDTEDDLNLKSEDFDSFSIDEAFDAAMPSHTVAESLETEREEVRKLMGTEDRFFVPDDLLVRLLPFAHELERRYDSKLRWVQGVPDPYGLDHEYTQPSKVLKAVWMEAVRLETRRRQQCDNRRVFVSGPQCGFTVEDPALRGLSAYSEANNSIFTTLIVSLQSYLEGRLRKCHGTGLKLVSPIVRFLHPSCYSMAHGIHGLPMSHGFSSPSPSSLDPSEYRTLAQNFVFESRYFNFWRGSCRMLISSLDMNKRFGMAFARTQGLDARLSLSEADLDRIDRLTVLWRDDVDQRIHINVYSHTEQTLFHHLTRP